MRLSVLIAIVALFWMGGASPAQASADGGCPLQWKLERSDRSTCSNMAILHPGNDTRANLILLMTDELRSPPFKSGGGALFTWGELGSALFPALPRRADGESDLHSRCQTNKHGADAYIGALERAKGLDKVERDALIEARQAVQPDCQEKSDGMDDLAKLPAVSSKMAKAFKTYLSSALAFYRGDFDEATVGFSSIVKSKIKNAWLREASLYMIARSELNRSQTGAFGRYGWFEGPEATDKGAVKNAERGFELYLKQYPKGNYASSARGLMRRVYWLGGDSGKLSNEYAKAIKDPASIQFRITELVSEVDHKLLPALVRNNDASDPALAAMVLLYRMREQGYDFFTNGELPALTASDLEAMEGRFASQPRLFEYLQAVHAYYVEKKPSKVIQMIADDARQSNYNYLEFSRQALRGMALEAVGDRNARGFWKQLMGGATAYGQRASTELALTMNLERGSALQEVYAKGSPIQQRDIRDILLLRAAGPDLLRKQANNNDVDRHERNIALYTLLYKSLTRGRYSDFLKDIKLVPSDAKKSGPYYGFHYESDYGYEQDIPVPVGMFSQEVDYDDFQCPQLKQTAAQLSKNPKNHEARVCLADYLRIMGFDNYWLEANRSADELGGSKSQFPGERYSRLEVYKDLIDDRKSPANVRAYALYRAVWCYGSAGRNSCGGTEVPTSTRASWFRDLKRNYPNTKWAKELKYYW